VGAGFTLIARRPLAVLAWGLMTGVFLILAVATMAPMVNLFLANIGRTPASFDWQSNLATMVRFQTTSTLVNLGSIFLRAVIACAVFRAMLTPEASAFAYMRIGMSELFLAVFLFGAAIALVLLMLVVAAPFVLCVVWLAVAHNAGGAVALGLAGTVVEVGLVLWLLVRLSLLGPMIVASGEFPLGEAWALSRGRAGALFLTGLFIVLILMAVQAVVFGVAGGVGVSLIGAFPHDLAELKSFLARPFGDLAVSLAPLLALAWLAISLYAGVSSAILWAPWAAAYRQLAPAAAPVAPTT
jgi:hypothetical protein